MVDAERGADDWTVHRLADALRAEPRVIWERHWAGELVVTEIGFGAPAFVAIDEIAKLGLI